MMSYFKAAFDLSRPLNSIITGLTVVVGGLIAANVLMPDVTLLLAGLSAALIAAGGNAVNDVYDAAIDKINRPTRPIPSGMISKFHAVIMGIVWMLIGCVIGISLSLQLGLIALIVSLLLWGYSSWWKKRPLIGNLVVSLCGGLAFIYGAVAVDNVKMGLIPALFAFLIHLGREIVKDCEDEEGDRGDNARTLPILLGRVFSFRLSASVLLLLVITTFIPYQLNWYGLGYLMVIVIGVDIPLLTIAVTLWFKSVFTQSGLRLISNSLKIIMLIGLIGLYIG